ncbi:MAG TPA: hypothetical protein VF698_04305 [Thermoanaerobaculia bacterium]|jgi:antitoxin (DNA-binding transcriptional repressor) of toxin-antitoxin stability system
MNRRVTVEELREHLEEHLEHVRDGDTLTVVEDGRTWLELVSKSTLRMTRPDPALGRFQDVPIGPRPETLTTTVLDLLAEDREGDF